MRGVLVGMALVVAVGGCSAAPPEAAPPGGASGPPVAASESPTPVAVLDLPADPVAAVQEAVRRSLGTTGRLVGDANGPRVRGNPFQPDGYTIVEFDGHFDGPAGQQRFAARLDTRRGSAVVRRDVVVTDREILVQQAPTSWTRLAAGRLGAEPPLRAALHPMSHVRLLGAVVAATGGRDGRYEGFFDARPGAIASAQAPAPAGLEMARIGRWARDPARIPFDAKVDDQGRLTYLTYELDVDGNAYWTFQLTLTALGTPVTIALPPADQVTTTIDTLAEAW